MKNGKQLKEAGIQQALDHAGTQWQKGAGEMLCQFIKRRKRDFRTEEFRAFAEKKGLPNPPSLRSFGGIINSAARRGVIRQVGYSKVENPKAHQANAAVWSAVR